jgi:hypothetical protein
MSEKYHLNKRGRRVRAIALAGAASVTGYGASALAPGVAHTAATVAHDVAHPTSLDSDPTIHLPGDTHYQTVTISTPEEGADAVIRQVEPAALDSVSAETELENFINAQGMAANHQLEFGQSVRVPIIEHTHQNSANR